MMSSTYINRVQRLKQHLRCFLVDVSTFAPRQGLLYHACSKPPSRNRGGQPEGIYGSSRLNTTCFGSAELPGILRFDRQSASPSSLRLWKLGRYRIDSCYLHVPAISRSFWKGKQGLPFVSPQSRTWCVTKLTCCKTDPQDSTSRTLFRRSVVSCLFFSGHSFHRVNASGFIASRLRDVSSEFFSSAAAVQFSQTWVTV